MLLSQGKEQKNRHHNLPLKALTLTQQKDEKPCTGFRCLPWDPGFKQTSWAFGAAGWTRRPLLQVERDQRQIQKIDHADRDSDERKGLVGTTL